MERRISSSFTEFYKLYGVLCIAMFFAVFGFRFFDPQDLWFSVFILSTMIVNAFFALDFRKMKKVEMTDSGLLISHRTFFKQKITFVPYEKIESVKNKLWWLGNLKRISIKFTEMTDFGREITFISQGFTRPAQAEIVEELNRTVIRNKTSGKISSAYGELNS